MKALPFDIELLNGRGEPATFHIRRGTPEDLDNVMTLQQTILDALDNKDLYAPLTEEETLERMIRKKAGVPHHLEEKEMRRLYGFLARKGFSGGAVSKAVRRYEGLAED